MNRKQIPTTYDEARTMLNGRRQRNIANNTALVDQGEGVIGLRLHSTVVVVFDDSGHIILNTGGYRTVTTKDRLNRVARAHGWSIYAKDFDWFIVKTGQKAVPFENGFTIAPTAARELQRADHCTHPDQDWCDCDWCRYLRSKPDFTVKDHGTIFLVHPQNDAAREHLEENVSGEAQYFGNALAVEHRYICDLVAGLREHGFRVAA